MLIRLVAASGRRFPSNTLDIQILLIAPGQPWPSYSFVHHCMCINCTSWCVTVLFLLGVNEPINMFISPPTHPSVCEPFKIQCKSLTFCCFGYGALKTTEMNRPSLLLPPCSSSYRLFPLLCKTISPLGSSFFLLAVTAGGQRYKCWSGFSSPTDLDCPIPSLSHLLLLPLCFSVWVLLSSCAICPLSRSHMVEKRLHGSNPAWWVVAYSVFLINSPHLQSVSFFVNPI